jgi:hypothetical protein
MNRGKMLPNHDFPEIATEIVSLFLGMHRFQASVTCVSPQGIG